MSKQVKTMIISEVRKRLGESRDFLVVDVSKVDALKLNTLRLKAQKQGIKILGVKNSLARKALSEVGVTSLDHCLTGSSSLIYGGADVVALSKEVLKWTKEKELKDKLVVKGGTVDGAPLDQAGVDALSKSPGKPELLGQILTLIRSPGAKVAGALLGPGGYLAGQVKSLAEKEEGKEDSGEAAPAA